MTEETKLIWRRMEVEKQATLNEIVGWTTRQRGQVMVTITLMIRAGQLKFIRRRKRDGRAVYGKGIISTYGWFEP